ncbi:MAG TPA: aryl-sulfate sulfotransferase [Terriglobales bacterium]
MAGFQVSRITSVLGTVALLLSATAIQASTLFIGSNATGPVQRYTTAGSFLGSFGQNGATGTALDGAGYVYTAQPGNTSTITKYDATETPVATTVFSSGVDNGGGFPNFVTDMAYGGASTLWLAGYNGMVYRVNTAGNVLAQFDTGSVFTGIATDGTFLYTSEGIGGGNIYQRASDGTLITTIATGLPETLGLAFDAQDGSFWVGGTDTLTQVSSSGAILNTLSIPGFHDGLEVGDIGTAAVPEPATFLISGLGLAGLFLLRKNRSAKTFLPCVAVLAALVSWTTPRLDAAITIQLTPSPAQPQPVGTTITWTASATDTSAGTLDYRFSIRQPGGSFLIVRDFDSSPQAKIHDWTPGENEGSYDVQVTVRNRTTNVSAARTAMYLVTSRVTGSGPVVSPTSHPLVALYSAPPCAAGSRMRVRFQRPSDTYAQMTPFKPCTPATSMNFYIAGMLANTQYQMKHDIFTGPSVQTGPTLSFTTGTLPFTFPVTTVLDPADPPSSLQQGILLHSFFSQGTAVRLFTATNLNGQVVWYLPQPGQVGGGGGIRYRPVAGGTFLQERAVTRMGSNLQELNLLGNIVRETNVGRVNDQLVAMGKQPITSFHHDAFRLPNGYTAAISSVERLLTNVQGAGTVDVLGDAIVVLDTNFQVVWFWNSFDHLDATRKAVLDEKCTVPGGGGGCPPYFLANVANDWMHSNSVAYTPDGHLLVSVRHQDWVIKINYANGTGTGNVIWRLGKGGDFSINSSDPYPWFSHSHDAEFELGSNQLLSLYDNGNTRRLQFPSANSRGQVYQLDLVNRTATLQLNADLGVYSGAVGSAQRLINGNYHFTSGNIAPGPFAQSTEVNPSAQVVSRLQTESGTFDYRSFRMKDMYSLQ